MYMMILCNVTIYIWIPSSCFMLSSKTLPAYGMDMLCMRHFASTLYTKELLFLFFMYICGIAVPVQALKKIDTTLEQ